MLVDGDVGRARSCSEEQVHEQRKGEDPELAPPAHCGCAARSRRIQGYKALCSYQTPNGQWGYQKILERSELSAPCGAALKNLSFSASHQCSDYSDNGYVKE